MAGSKKDNFETNLLQLIFNNTNLANIGDNTGLRGSTAAGNFYIALYTAAPSDSAAGTETVYTNYVRVAVLRASGAGGWTIAANNASNASAITFAQCGTTGATLCAFSVCKESSGDNAIYWGDLTSNLVVSSGITPEFAVGELDVNED
jgi:hypothetical protein